MDATIGKGYSVGLTSTMVFCPECHQGVTVPIDGDRADIAAVRAHLQGHYGAHAMVDFQVADMLTKALGFGAGGGGVVGAGNPDQPNSSSSTRGRVTVVAAGGSGGGTAIGGGAVQGGSSWTIGDTTYF